MQFADGFEAVGPSAVVASYAAQYAEEAKDLNFAFHVRQLLVALDSTYTFHRSAALARLYRLIRDLPAPRNVDPFASLAREGSTGKNGSAPSLVASVLKRTFPSSTAGGAAAGASAALLASCVAPPAAVPLGGLLADADGTDLTATASGAAAANAKLPPLPLTAPAGWAEMELALRVCQGVCILSPSQRKLTEDSRLVDVICAVLDGLPNAAYVMAAQAGRSGDWARSPTSQAAVPRSPNLTSTFGSMRLRTERTPRGNSPAPAKDNSGVQSPLHTAEPSTVNTPSNRGVTGTENGSAPGSPDAPPPVPPAFGTAALLATTTTTVHGPRATSMDSPSLKMGSTVNSATGPTAAQLADAEAKYRVALAAMETLEATVHFSPASLLKAVKKGAVRRLVNVLADQRHPSVMREAAADVLGSMLVQTASVQEWPDRATANALENETRAHFRIVLDRRRELVNDESFADASASNLGRTVDFTKGRPAATTAVQMTAMQVIEMTKGLRDYRGLVAYQEMAPVVHSTSTTMALRTGDFPASPHGTLRGTGAHTSRGTAAANQTGKRTVAAKRDADTTLLKRQTARKARFGALLAAVALPRGFIVE
jgi:hypothetical protein